MFFRCQWYDKQVICCCYSVKTTPSGWEKFTQVCWSEAMEAFEDHGCNINRFTRSVLPHSSACSFTRELRDLFTKRSKVPRIRITSTPDPNTSLLFPLLPAIFELLGRPFWDKCTKSLHQRSKDLGALLDSCSWDDIGNFLQTCIKNSLLH